VKEAAVTATVLDAAVDVTVVLLKLVIKLNVPLLVVFVSTAATPAVVVNVMVVPLMTDTTYNVLFPPVLFPRI
jgi:hypothetical protein